MVIIASVAQSRNDYPEAVQHGSDSSSAMDTATTYVAPRTCTIVDEGETTRAAKKRTAPLSDYANAAAYVLIAEPGAGKTTAFKTEAAKQGALYVTVRNFRTFDRPEWRGRTLFLDGLGRVARGNRGWPDAAGRYPEEAGPFGTPALPAVLPVG